MMTLIIAEASVARDIAAVVGAKNREKGYYHGNDYLVSWCVGHMVVLAKPEDYDPSLKTWSIDTLPIIPSEFLTTVSASTLDQFNVLQTLMNRSDVSEIIEATSAGREGELAFRLVYEKTGCTKPFKRLWLNSMEEESIRDGLNHLKDGKEYDNLFKAALCRQRADFLIGINFTRLYSKMYNKTLNVGRVQTATTNLIVKRQREIFDFMPNTYYTLIADMECFKAYSRAKNKNTASKIAERCSGTEAYVASVKTETFHIAPPALYDLVSLQQDATRILGYTAQQTQDYVHNLFNNRLTTYPFNCCRYITDDMEQPTKFLIESLIDNGIYSTGITNDIDTKDVSVSNVVNNELVVDHHAILPTGSVTKEQFESLPTGEKNIFMLIAYRLLIAAYIPHSYSHTNVIFDIEGEAFSASTSSIIDRGYKMIESRLSILLQPNIEPEPEQSAEPENSFLPPLSEGDRVPVLNVMSKEHKTRPPEPYTDSTLLEAMDTAGQYIFDDNLREAIKGCGLGTDSTRASIIENMIKYGYVRRDNTKLLPTETAFTYIDVIASKLKEPDLTAEWEKKLSDINMGVLSADDFMQQVTSFIQSFISDIKIFYSPDESADIFHHTRDKIGVCPRCGKNIVETPKAFSCEGMDCKFILWKTIKGREINKYIASNLLSKGKTALLTGFKSAAGKNFAAYLYINDDKAIGFEYPSKSNEKSTVCARI
jgi:DNA topoisomerase-3